MKLFLIQSYRFISFLIIIIICFSPKLIKAQWAINTTEEWKHNEKNSEGFSYENGFAIPISKISTYQSIIKTFNSKRSVNSIVFKQHSKWLNWEQVNDIKPVNLGDAPVFLSLGPNNYWLFGRYTDKQNKRKHFIAKDTILSDFGIPLKTTPFPNQYNTSGGLKEGLGGYHAWQSRDMINWVHHGSVTEKFSKWVTTAEYADGKSYIYYDYPNDQDPHVYIDDDLKDGKPGNNMGMAFKDPSSWIRLFGYSGFAG
ncbi:MAG: hypothetical protein U5L09_12965 [Bacteroidales bacterium]|nr:hypothetical protein [Bacteroidales bacterium]